MIALLAHAWWSGFVFASSAPLGALALRLIARLTGGRWAEAEPLARLASTTPWLCLVVLPGLVLDPAHFPAARQMDVGVYMAAPDQIARTLLALAGWSLVAVGMQRFSGRLFAALGLIFHGVAVSLVSVDWIMATSPGWVSSAGGMTLADQQIALALALTLIGLGRAGDKHLADDLGGLLAASLLGDLYFALMTYVVPWYADLSRKTLWFRQRQGPLWQGLIALALGLGSAAPLLVLGAARRRLGSAAGIVAASAATFGLALQSLWWTAPAPDVAALPLDAVFIALAAAGLVALARGFGPTFGGRPAHVR